MIADVFGVTARACVARWRVVALTLVAMIAMAVWPPASRAALPPQGVYEQCAPGVPSCVARLADIRAAGFTVVLNYMQWYGDAEEIRRYAAQAHALGIKLIYPLNAAAWRQQDELPRLYGALARDCACDSGAQLAAWAIGLVKEDPATWGWYVGDELAPAELPALQALSSQVRRLDPAHPQLYVSYENAATLGENLRPFAAVPDVLGADYYPVGTPFDPAATGALAARIQQLADDGGQGSAVVLQAFSWGQYPHSAAIEGRWPTRTEMALQRDLVLGSARPQLILWYSFFDIARSDEPARHLDDLVSAAFGPEPALPAGGSGQPRAPVAQAPSRASLAMVPGAARPAAMPGQGQHRKARRTRRRRRRGRRGCRATRPSPLAACPAGGRAGVRGSPRAGTAVFP